MRRWAWVLLPALAGCALLTPAEEEAPRTAEEQPSLDVVDDQGPFDPSEAVTDEAEGEVEFDELAAGAPAAEVRSPREVRALEREREAAAEGALLDDPAAGDDPGRGATALAQRGPPEPAGWALADLGLELLVVAVLAAVITALIALGRTATRRHPRVALGVAGLVLLLGLIAIG